VPLTASDALIEEGLEIFEASVAAAVAEDAK
jgi:4-aminobutyrate aminotransferase / (S)-3-amino-2-methylpropionate transaminase / 5-aminovalerate transaminase